MTGTVLAILIVLNLRNGMALANVTGHIQTGVLGVLLILSVMVPAIQDWFGRQWRWGNGSACLVDCCVANPLPPKPGLVAPTRRKAVSEVVVQRIL